MRVEPFGDSASKGGYLTLPHQSYEKETSRYEVPFHPTKGPGYGNRRRGRTFEDLLVWQMGIELVKRVYVVTTNAWFSRDFELRSQTRRVSLSIPTNIAKGFDRTSRKEHLHFLDIAKGLAGEVRSLLYVALEIGSESGKL